MEEKPLPGFKAILLCERTMIEAGTGKISLIALIGTIAFPSFPAQTRPMKLFLHLVDGIGDYDITIEVHDLSDLSEGEIVKKTNAVRVSFPERLASRKLIFSVRSLSLPHAGRYDVIVLGKGRGIERLPIIAVAANSEA